MTTPGIVINCSGAVLAQVASIAEFDKWIAANPEYVLEQRTYLCDGQCYHFYVKSVF